MQKPKAITIHFSYSNLLERENNGSNQELDIVLDIFLEQAFETQMRHRCVILIPRAFGNEH